MDGWIDGWVFSGVAKCIKSMSYIFHYNNIFGHSLGQGGKFSSHAVGGSELIVQ